MFLFYIKTIIKKDAPNCAPTHFIFDDFGKSKILNKII